MGNFAPNLDDMVKSLSKKKKSFIVFKCPHKECTLFYDSILGLKRHLLGYDHSLYFSLVISEKCPVYGCSWLSLRQKKEEFLAHMKKTHLQKDFVQLTETFSRALKTYEVTLDTLAKQSEDNEIADLSLLPELKEKSDPTNEKVITFKDIVYNQSMVHSLMSNNFPKGIIRMNELDKPDLYFCGISGCGKHFKSKMAYKYHCNTFTHSLFSIFDSFCRTNNLDWDYESLVNILRMEFGVEDKFILNGIFHHSTFSPDQTFPIAFSISKDYFLKSRRPRKREMNIAEYNTLFTDDFSITEISEQFESIPSKISYRGQKFDENEEEYTSHFKFHNFKEEITASDRFNHIFCICTKELDQKARKMFDFHTGKCSIIFFDDREIRHKFDFETGYVRKIKINSISGSIVYFALSNDGLVKIYRDETVHFTFEQPNITDFTILNNYEDKEIVLCDSFQLYKFKSGQLTITSTAFEFPILSLESRSKKPDEPEIYLLDANGKIFFCDSQFRNQQEVYTNVGTTNLIYLRDLDGLLLCDSFLGCTKLMYLHDKKRKVSQLQSNFTSCAENHNKLIITGTFNGYVTSSQISSRKKIKFDEIFKFIRRKDHYILCSDEQELNHFTLNPDMSFDLSTCILFVYHMRNHFVLGFKNGFVVFVDV